MRPSRPYQLVRLLAIVALASSIVPFSAARETKPLAVDFSALAKAPFEVRLRKLHLVRPDLIPYPIMFDVYC